MDVNGNRRCRDSHLRWCYYRNLEKKAIIKRKMLKIQLLALNVAYVTGNDTVSHPGAGPIQRPTRDCCLRYIKGKLRIFFNLDLIF